MGKIQEGIDNPDKIPTFLLRLARGKYYEYIRYRGASLYNDQASVATPSNHVEAIYRSYFPDFFEKHDIRNFPTYLVLPQFAFFSGCNTILEIGAGASTAIWARYAKLTGASVTSIDAAPDRLEEYYHSDYTYEEVCEYVDFLNGVSITKADLMDYYSTPRLQIGGVPVSSFESDLDAFAKATGCPQDRIKRLHAEANTSSWTLADILLSDDGMSFPESYIQTRINQSSIEEHGEWLEKLGSSGIIDELLQTQGRWDFIWFDSGEVSSMVEWEKLKDAVTPGGLAAFHDIFFPKSMKNFAIVASLLHDSEWEVLLIDDSTRQGLCIAQKQREERSA